ncbi:MAG: four helix bundle protein [bacterium]|nr:four helix bundle protein [bacterium]
MQSINSYKDLIVWQKAIDVVADTYAITRKFPSFENFGLSSQMQRAAVSIAANIAEGRGRGTRTDYAHFLDISNGSVSELETLLTIAKRLSYCREEQCSRMEEQLGEIGKMLGTLRAKLRRFS